MNLEAALLVTAQIAAAYVALTAVAISLGHAGKWTYNDGIGLIVLLQSSLLALLFSTVPILVATLPNVSLNSGPTNQYDVWNVLCLFALPFWCHYTYRLVARLRTNGSRRRPRIPWVFNVGFLATCAALVLLIIGSAWPASPVTATSYLFAVFCLVTNASLQLYVFVFVFVEQTNTTPDENTMD